MRIARLDHLVLTVADIQATCDFYTAALGMEAVTFGGDRKALVFGEQKINLHQAGKELDPKAANPTPGSADLCLITEAPIGEVLAHFQQLGIEIECGPAPKTGATGAIESVYIRDPDGNLIEIGRY